MPSGACGGFASEVSSSQVMAAALVAIGSAATTVSQSRELLVDAEKSPSGGDGECGLQSAECGMEGETGGQGDKGTEGGEGIPSIVGRAGSGDPRPMEDDEWAGSVEPRPAEDRAGWCVSSAKALLACGSVGGGT